MHYPHLYSTSFFSLSCAFGSLVHARLLKINGAHQIRFFLPLYLNEYKLKQLKRKLMKHTMKMGAIR